MADQTSQAFDDLWAEIFNHTLYSSIVRAALVFSVAILVFFMAQFMRKMLEEGAWQEAMMSLIWPVLVVALLANDGKLLAQGTRAIYEIYDDLAGDILEVTFLEVNIEDAIHAATLLGGVSTHISAQLRQCQALAGEEQIECLKLANAQAEADLGIFQTILNFTPGYIKDLGTGIDAALEGVENGNVQDVVGGFLGGLVGSSVQSISYWLMLGLHSGFSWLLEIANILAAVIGPMAVAGGLLPFEGKPIIAWLTSLHSLGMAKVSYMIVIGIASVVTVKAELWQPMGFLFILGLLGPALALAIGSFSGMALFRVVLSAPVILTSLAARLPMPSAAKK